MGRPKKLFTDGELVEALERVPKTDNAREKQLISLAYDVAERELRSGHPSSQIITHFLKAGAMREKLERQKLEEEVNALRAKTAALESAQRVEDLYTKALQAMRAYSGQSGSYYAEKDDIQ